MANILYFLNTVKNYYHGSQCQTQRVLSNININMITNKTEIARWLDEMGIIHYTFNETSTVT